MSKHDMALQAAQANARMGLMIAIGELQQKLGPDQRISAPAKSLSSSSTHGNLIGIWQSWGTDFDPLNPPSDYDSEKENRFLGFLASNQDQAALQQSDFAQQGSFSKPITLLGEGTLGKNAPQTDYLTAGLVPINSDTSSNSSSGSYAWAAMDEGTKARINGVQSQYSGSLAETSAALGASTRAALEKAVNAYDPAKHNASKFLTLPSTQLGLSTDMKQHTFDFSPWAASPMTSVTRGGLLQDINLLADQASLPARYKDKHIYSGKTSGLAESDPSWQQLYEYASLYKSVTEVGGKPRIKATVPEGFNAYDNQNQALKNPPSGAVLIPTIAKVQVAFSLITRNAHGGWAAAAPADRGDSQSSFLLHMIYSPTVTLYNPYNVPLEFDHMRVEFHNIPISFQFTHNGKPQTHSLVPLNQLYVWNQDSPDKDKSFAMVLSNKSGSDESPDLNSPIVLDPGATMVFSPYLPPAYSWNDDSPGVGKDGVSYFDWRSDKTANIPAVPGWRGAGIGFDIDWIAPHNPTIKRRDVGVVPLRLTDNIAVKYAPIPAAAAEGKFVVSAQLSIDGKDVKSNAIELNYGSNGTLQSLLPPPDGKSYQFPQAGEASLTGASTYESGDTPIADYENIKTFCLFSAYAKTSTGGAEGAADGRYASKAWLFNSPSSAVAAINLAKEHPAIHSHEFNFEPTPGHVENHIDVDAHDRGSFITGHTQFNGIKAAPHYEIPIAPLQSLSQLQHAGLASSGYLPKFDYPVANSLAHPLLPVDKVKSSSKSGYDLLDHSYLLNHNLYDQFYCSGIASYNGGMFGTGRNTQEVLTDYLKGEKPILDRRLNTRIPSGKTAEDIVSDLVGSNNEEAYLKIANYQTMKGRFNVNSVSVPAWKTLLAGLTNSSFPILDIESGEVTTKTNSGTVFSRFRLPNGNSIDEDSTRKSRWTGYRELSDNQLEQLAEEIVQEVKDRGPFLSVSEFINRRLEGSDAQMQKGTLQAAIDRTDINKDFAADGIRIDASHIKGHGYANETAALGDSATGAPGYLSQADLLGVLGNAVSVRSDTFTIRAYGEAKDNTGRVTARAWCEAVVQRTPDYVDLKDENHLTTAELTSDTNKKLGRKINLIAFRWLHPEEI